MVIQATTTMGGVLAMKVEDPPTSEDLRRLAALSAMPGMDGAGWTCKPGSDVR